MSSSLPRVPHRRLMEINREAGTAGERAVLVSVIVELTLLSRLEFPGATPDLVIVIVVAIALGVGEADALEEAQAFFLEAQLSAEEAAIAEAAPTTIHADQHYLAANHFLTCSAAPIVDHRGDVVGVLDVSGDHRSYHQHTMALVRMSALMIENRIFTATFDNAITLHFHARPEFIGTLMEGIASFTPGTTRHSARVP